MSRNANKRRGLVYMGNLKKKKSSILLQERERELNSGVPIGGYESCALILRK